MEIIAVLLGVGIILGVWERRERRQMFPDQQCAHCPQWIHLEGHVWVHDDGDEWGDWPCFDYTANPNNPRHPASPSFRPLTLS